MSYGDFAKSIKSGSDDYVRNNCYGFNFGRFDYLKGSDLYDKVMNLIFGEMDARHLW